MRKEDLLTLAFAVDAGAPLTLETTHLSTESAVIGLLLASPLAFSLYLVLRSSWPDLGLFSYVSRHELVGRLQLYSWVGSYFLYLSYTLDYAFLYQSPREYLPFLVSVASTLLVLTTDVGSYLVLPLAFLQLALSFPLGWRYSPLPLGTTGVSFTELLDSSLLLVCLTLVPYWRGRRENAWMLLLSLGLSGFLGVLGSFLITDEAGALQALSMVGLVTVEGIALRNLLREWKPARTVLPLAFIVTVALSFINPVGYYLITIPPSVALLYLSLLTVFPFLPLRGWKRVLSLWSAGLMGYGLYDSLILADRSQLIVITSALLITALLASWRVVRKALY